MADHITVRANKMMEDAEETARMYARGAKAFLQELTPGSYPDPAIMSAYMTAAAIDSSATLIAQQIRAGLDTIADAIRGNTSDHPLQGETFGELSTALSRIAEAIDNCAPPR